MAGDRQVTLTWDNPNWPADRSGTTKYRWEYRRRAGTGAWSAWRLVAQQCAYCPVYRGPRVLHTVTGLSNGTAYSLDVRRLAYGQFYVLPKTVSATPSGSIAPVRVVPGPGANQLTVEWSPPHGYGGGQLYEGYELHWKSGTQGYDRSRRLFFLRGTVRWTLRDLEPGTEYTVRVRFGSLKDRVLGEAKGTPSASGQQQQSPEPEITALGRR